MIHSFDGRDFLFILVALRWTIALTVLAFIGGSLIGLIVALARSSANPFFRLPALGYVIAFQGTPILVQILLIFFGLGAFGWPVSAWAAAGIALSLSAGALLGETWRGCLEAVPGGQRAASAALGLTRFHGFMYVVLPQAVRLSIAPTVGILVQIVKETSLASIIGLTEITRAGQIVTSTTLQPFTVYCCVAALYFSLCWPLSYLSSRLESARKVRGG